MIHTIVLVCFACMPNVMTFGQPIASEHDYWNRRHSDGEHGKTDSEKCTEGGILSKKKGNPPEIKDIQNEIRSCYIFSVLDIAPASSYILVLRGASSGRGRQKTMESSGWSGVLQSGRGRTGKCGCGREVY